MKLKNALKAALFSIGLAMIGSSAQAGNLTFALDGGVYKNFSVAPAIYYSQILAPNLGVNAYISGKYTFAFPENWYAGLGASLNYAIPIARDKENFFEGLIAAEARETDGGLFDGTAKQACPLMQNDQVRTQAFHQREQVRAD